MPLSLLFLQIFRALAGIGGGGILTSVMIIGESAELLEILLQPFLTLRLLPFSVGRRLVEGSREVPGHHGRCGSSQ